MSAPKITCPPSANSPHSGKLSIAIAAPQAKKTSAEPIQPTNGSATSA